MILLISHNSWGRSRSAPPLTKSEIGADPASLPASIQTNYLDRFRPHSVPLGNRGFTLVELIVVMLLVAVLGLVAMPRFFKVSPFQEWGFSDELSSALRYANKVAIATGCDARVVTTSTSYELKQRVSCRTGSFTRDVQISGSASGYRGVPPNGITLSVANFYFDSNGRPRNSTSDALLTSVTTLTVGSTVIMVEPETGYIHR